MQRYTFGVIMAPVNLNPSSMLGAIWFHAGDMKGCHVCDFGLKIQERVPIDKV